MYSEVKNWIKTDDSFLARQLKHAWRSRGKISMPVIKPLHGVLYLAHKSLTGFCSAILRVFYYTPLFKTVLQNQPKALYLYGGLPQVLGAVAIELGNGCRVAGKTTISGRLHQGKPALLSVGDNVDIGWMNNIAVGTQITLGNNVRLAPRVTLSGYSGHAVDAQQRAEGLPEHPGQRKPIVLEDDVWIASGVIINAGVTVGRGTIVAAGSVVTKSLPAGVLAGGNPAKVIKPL